MRRKLGMTAVLVVALAVAGYAQKKADFSGTWTLDADKSEMAPTSGGGGRGGMMAGPMTIRQTADTLTIERQGPNGAITQTYKLDGSESENKMMGRGGEMTVKSKAKWDGDKLVIESTREGQNGPVTNTATYSLQGASLVVENAGGRGPSKLVYKKAT
jgi:hypothetical protein